MFVPVVCLFGEDEQDQLEDREQVPRLGGMEPKVVPRQEEASEISGGSHHSHTSSVLIR